MGGRALRLERVGIFGCVALLGGLEGVARMKIGPHGDVLW